VWCGCFSALQALPGRFRDARKLLNDPPPQEDVPGQSVLPNRKRQAEKTKEPGFDA
jgi:hypothetical protein